MREEILQVRRGGARSARGALGAAVFLAALPAHASFLSGEALDTAANVLSWFVILVIPLVAIGAFLYVHVLPEVIAERRHHPHKDSIKVLCILSLFFGGMLWPFAWLWAYTRPIGYRAIYGTEKHEDYYVEQGEKVRSGDLDPAEIEHLRRELAAMEGKGTLSPPLRRLKEDLDVVAEVATPPAQKRAASAAAGGKG